MRWIFHPGEFCYVNELVEFISVETGDWFHIEVAAYPEMYPQAKSPQDDVQRFRFLCPRVMPKSQHENHDTGARSDTL